MNRIIVITGSASGIGKATRLLFEQMGDIVCGIDVQEGEYWQGDIADPAVVKAFADQIISDYGRVDVLINNVPPLKKGISDCSYGEFMYALQAGAAAPWYLTKLLKDHFTDGGSIINISSSRDSQSQPESESYAAAKGAIHALTHAMAMSLAPKIRVNSISPGWIETSPALSADCSEDLLQHPVGRIGKPSDAAWLIAFLASEAARFIDGENIKLDGGMSRQMIYHNDFGWNYTAPARTEEAEPEADVEVEEIEVAVDSAEPQSAETEIQDKSDEETEEVQSGSAPATGLNTDSDAETQPLVAAEEAVSAEEDSDKPIQD